MSSAASRLAAAIGAAALGMGAVGAVAGSQHARAADGHFVAAPPAWSNCQDPVLSQAGAQCASLKVPLDWSRPDGEKIELALSRVKATHDRQGVMLSNPGGPGGSGLAMPAFLPQAVPNDVGHTYDWIGFDPRGVGSSRPALTCESNYLAGPRPAYRPADQAAAAPNEKAWIARTVAYTKDCAQHNGHLLEHVHTSDTIRDMDAIRAALGERKINYYGFSYGTFIGQAYATVYPSHLARMVLDGNVPPDYPGYGDGGRAQMTSFQYVITRFFSWIASHDSVYHLGTTAAAVNAAYTAVENALTAQPVGDVGAAEWDDVFLTAGYAESRWPGVAAAFADWVSGNTVAINNLYRVADHPGDDNEFAAFNSTYCIDGPFPTDYGKVRADGFSIAAQAPLPAWGGFWFSAPCTWWPVRPGTPLKVDGRALAKLHTAILLINATRDGATPFAGALAVRRAFPSSALIAEVDGTTHAGSLQGNSCVDRQIADYLATGKLPTRAVGDRADAECKRMPWPEPSLLDRSRESGSPLDPGLPNTVTLPGWRQPS